MKRLTKQQLLSLAFLSYCVAWLAVIAWGLLVNRLFGITAVEDIDNAKLILELVNEKPMILLFPSLDFFLGGAIISIAILLSHLTENTVLNDLQKHSGLFAGVFFIYGAYSRLTTFLKLAHSNNVVNELKFFGYDIVNYLQYGNSFAVQGFLSAWLIAFHFLQQKRKQGNKMINSFGILAGSIGLFAFVIQPLAAVLIFANIGCSFYWFIYYKKQANTILITD